MTSINFNSAATTALRTLQQTNSALETSQNRVSTGLKIGEAKDNAAYWSISTTLKSDNKALSTVKDALGLGSATVDTAYQGLTKAKEVLDEIKSKLTAATQDGVDRTKVQAEISQLQEQLKSIASSSSFSGENWLSVVAKPTSTSPVVASFTRGPDNAISVGTINIDTASAVLIETGTGNNGILDLVDAGNTKEFVAASTQAFTLTATTAVAATDKIIFTVTQGNGAATQVAITAATMTSAGLTTISSKVDLVAVVNQALKDAKISNVNVGLNNAGDRLQFSSTNSLVVSGASNVGSAPTVGLVAALGLDASTVNASTASLTAYSASVLTMDISAVTLSTQVQAYIDIVSKATDKVITAAATLGAVSSRIEMQNSFVDTLMDTIDKGISNLVDADLSEESTRLQALQTKQQLGIQALSIANTSTQNILSLFRS